MAKVNFSEFEKELAELLNRHGMDSHIGMAAHVLADMITDQLGALRMALSMQKHIERKKMATQPQAVTINIQESM